MITKTLKDFASPIVENAMVNGRSQTTTVTDYSGIRDAINANNDLKMRVTEFKYNSESRLNDMRANNSLKALEIEKEWMRERDEIYAKAAASHMGDFEKALGTLQGAASGAQAGYAAGGPWGAVAGGVIGGVASGSEYYSGQDDARERGQRANQMLGGIATTAVALRGMYDAHKGKEVASKGMKELGKMKEGLDAMNPQARAAAVAKYEGKIAAINAEASKYMGPEELRIMNEQIRSGRTGTVSADPIERARANLAANGLAAAADERLFSNGPEAQAVLKGYHADNNRQLGVIYGYDGNHGMGNNDFVGWAGSVSPELGRSAQEMYAPKSIQARATGGGGNYASAAPGGSGGQAGNQPVNPTRGPSIQQQEQPISAPVAPNNFVQNPGIGVGAPAGIAMDDGQGFMRDPIGELTKIGTTSAQILQKNEQMTPEQQEAAQIANYEGRMENAPISQKLTEEYPKGKMKKDFMNARDKVLDEAMKILPGGREGAEAPFDFAPGSDLESKARQKLDINPAVKKQIAKEVKAESNVTVTQQQAKSIADDRVVSKQLDMQINQEFEKNVAPYLIDKTDKDKADNIFVTIDNVNRMEQLVGKIPNDSQLKAKASEFLLNGISAGKDKDGLLSNMVLLKGNVPTVIGANLVDKALSAVKGDGTGRGSAKAISQILSPEEIQAVEEYARVEALALQSLVKTGDKGVVNEGEIKLLRPAFYNYGQSADRQQKAIISLKENMLSKMSGSGKTAKPHYNATINQDKELIRYRGDIQMGKAYTEGYNRQTGANEANMEKDAMKKQIHGGVFEW